MLSPPIVPPSQQPAEQPLESSASASVQGEEDPSAEEDEEVLTLLYDPCLNCYFDPQTGKYYELHLRFVHHSFCIPDNLVIEFCFLFPSGLGLRAADLLRSAGANRCLAGLRGPAHAPAEMVGLNSAIAAGVCGALFFGYCIYFDRKRRSDPNFKNGLRERRKKQKLAKERAGLSKLPDLKDAEAVQKFFPEEVQLGEELLAQGKYEKGVDHLTNAIAVCGQPQQLLQDSSTTSVPDASDQASNH
ncbi:translocase of outer mitochondrial membrane 20 [Cricetulus griseus]